MFGESQNPANPVRGFHPLARVCQGVKPWLWGVCADVQSWAEFRAANLALWQQNYDPLGILEVLPAQQSIPNIELNEVPPDIEVEADVSQSTFGGETFDTLLTIPELLEPAGTDREVRRSGVPDRRHGGTAKAQKRLDNAIEMNRYVPDYLTGRDGLPDEQPDCFSFGGKEEAIICAALLTDASESSPGALEWLRQRTKRR